MYLIVITQKTDTKVMKIENPLIPINVKSAMESSHSVLWKGISYVNIGEQDYGFPSCSIEIRHIYRTLLIRFSNNSCVNGYISFNLTFDTK